jgi:hypothetical protein
MLFGCLSAVGIRHRLHWSVACVGLLVAQPVLAQSGGVAGVVRDPQQAVVPGAQVVLIGLRPTARSTTVTDASGRYSFTLLQPGRYVVEVHIDGFQVARSPEIVLAEGESAIRDFALALAGTTESVTVTAVGRVDQVYRVNAVDSLGSAGSTQLLDTPYSVNVLPGELIVNWQVKSFMEAS